MVKRVSISKGDSFVFFTVCISSQDLESYVRLYWLYCCKIPLPLSCYHLQLVGMASNSNFNFESLSSLYVLSYIVPFKALSLLGDDSGRKLPECYKSDHMKKLSIHNTDYAPTPTPSLWTNCHWPYQTTRNKHTSNIIIFTYKKAI